MSVNILTVDKVRSLLCPESIAIIGASSKPGSWSQMVWNSLKRLGYPGPVYLVNPRYETLWDSPCYPDISKIPDRPEHLVINLPANVVISALEEGAKAGARSATIFAGGFGEGGDAEGLLLRKQLQEVIAKTGLAVSGPNCNGNLCARSGLVTLAESSINHIQKLETSPIAIVGQSGGIVPAINRSLTERGLPYAGYLITTGNELGLTLADYIEYLVSDEDVRVIVTFMESMRNSESFLAACHKAREAGKSIVMVKMGGSEGGRAAALAHTGSLTGSLHAFDAITKETGIIRVNNLDDVVETVEYLLHCRPPAGRRIGGITISGGVKGLLLESADRQGMSFPKLASETEQKLCELLPVGTSVGNPLDMGFGGLSSQEIYLKCIDLMLADPNIDVILLQEELPRYSIPWKEDNMRKLNAKVVEGVAKPIAVFSMISHSHTEHSRSLRRELTHLPFLQEVDKALRAVQSVIDALQQGKSREEYLVKSTKYTSQIKIVEDICKGVTVPAGGLIPLNEVDSKKILVEYGIPVLNEKIVQSEQEAVTVAESIGYPVVLKGIAAKITHKSDAGIVKIGLPSREAVSAAFQDIRNNMERYGETDIKVLIAPFITGGLETVLGIHRDPEMGPVVMFGSGGVWLELYKDVAFGRVPLSTTQALEMIQKTKAGQLLQGFRGDSPRDVGTVAAALVGLSQMAYDLRDIVETVDVNPFSVLRQGQGAYALDGLVVLRS